LTTLELITEEGIPTDTFEAIRRAPEGEYQQRLADWLRAVYAEVFSYVDPAKDDETAVRDAFRGYHPIGQQPRMVSLFLTLCGAAGIAPEKPTQPRPGARWGKPNSPSTVTRTPAKKQLKQTKGTALPSGNIPAPLAGLLSQLPEEGHHWTKVRRDKFVETFGAVLDFCFPVDDGFSSATEEDEQ
jgi:hypothetical protein